MSSADPVEVTAMKSMIRMRVAPPSPRTCRAVAGGTRPEPASALVMGSCIARAARPSDVASAKGILVDRAVSGEPKQDERDEEGEEDKCDSNMRTHAWDVSTTKAFQ